MFMQVAYYLIWSVSEASNLNIIDLKLMVLLITYTNTFGCG